MKLLLIIIAFLFVGQISFGQDLFSRLPKPKYGFARMSVNTTDSSITVTQPTMQAVRFVANAATFAEPKHTAMAGFGVSYQWLKYAAANSTWTATYSINALLYGGGSITPPNTAVYGAGLSFGVLNNAITLGGAYIIPDKAFVFTLGANININNN